MTSRSTFRFHNIIPYAYDDNGLLSWTTHKNFSHLYIDDNFLAAFFCCFLEIVNKRKAPNKLSTVGNIFTRSVWVHAHLSKIDKIMIDLPIYIDQFYKHQVWTLIAWMIKWVNPLMHSFFGNWLMCTWKRVTNQIIEMFQLIIIICVFCAYWMKHSK